MTVLILACFQKEDGLLPKPPSSSGEEEEKPRGEASEDLCEMALDPELLLLRDDGEEEFGMCRPCAAAAGSVAGALLSPLCVWARGSLLHAHLSLPVAGAKLEDSEVRSVASNQSEMEFSSLQDMVSPLSCPPAPLTVKLSKASDSALGEETPL